MTIKEISFPESDIERPLGIGWTGQGVSRRDFLKGTGVLIVSFSMAGLAKMAETTTEADVTAFTDPDPKQLDSFLAITADGRVTVFNGKVDNGQGLATAFRQFVADELDVPFERTKIIMGDSALTPDQGGMSGSTAIERASPPLRKACAEARRVLLELASKRLGVPVEQLVVKDGVISVKENPSKSVSYGELIGGRRFNVILQWNGQRGNSLDVTGQAKPKTPDQYKVVGQSIPREDIPAVVFAQEHFVVDVRVPGMLHARSIKPPVAGATLVSVDESSVRNIPGLVKVVTKGNYVGVICEREEQAIRAAQQLKVTWSAPSAPVFPNMDDLYDYIRNTKPRSEQVNQNVGNVDAAFASAARVIEATYEWPFQSHASFGAGCAVADWRNGELTIYSGTQKPYDLRNGVATFLGLPREKVRCIWVEGPGSYGRNDAGEVGFEAALLAKEVGRPVRLQWMRDEGIAWDPKGPAVVIQMRGGLDAAGNVIAYDYRWKGFSGQDVDPREGHPAETLVGQMVGIDRQERQTRNTGGAPQETYNFPNKRKIISVIPPLLYMASPLRSAHIRDPQGPQSTFAGESFVDELAAAVGADSIQLRLRYLTDARHKAVVQAAAQAAGWETRPSPKPGATAARSGVVTGRGIAYAARGNPVVTTVAEVEVNLDNGQVRVTRFVCAVDCGLVVNPEGARNVVQANLIQSMSRTLKEEVRFDRTKVTSVDWLTYPIARITDVPDKIDIVFINPQKLEALGLGEPPTKPTAAAIANAVFDATGLRLRRVPFTPERVKAALAARG